MANVTLIPYIGLLTVETRGQGLAAARPRLTLPGLARFPRPAWADVISDRLHLGVDTDVPAWAGESATTSDSHEARTTRTLLSRSTSSTAPMNRRSGPQRTSRGPILERRSVANRASRALGRLAGYAMSAARCTLVRCTSSFPHSVAMRPQGR